MLLTLGVNTEFGTLAILQVIPPLIISVIAILIVVGVLFSIFYFQKRYNEAESKTNAYKQRLLKAKETYDKLVKDFEELKEKFKGNEEKIAELQSYIQELEEINAQLSKEKKIAEEKLRNLEELKKKRDEYFAMNIHDLKNPINVIKGYASLVKEYDLNADEQAEIMESMIRSADKMIAIVSDMTDVIKGDIDKEQKEQKTSREGVSIPKLLNGIIKSNMAYAKRKNIKITNNVTDALPEIQGETVKISSVLDNLINNAIKYGPPGTEVKIESKFDDNYLYIEVIDNGTGIPESELKTIFDKGVIGSNKPTSHEDQTGLGLWIVKDTIDNHGGEVWVKSKIKEGTTFGFKLPL